jgi:hypothetical protein
MPALSDCQFSAVGGTSSRCEAPALIERDLEALPAPTLLRHEGWVPSGHPWFLSDDDSNRSIGNRRILWPRWSQEFLHAAGFTGPVYDHAFRS